jgi:transposase
MELWRGTMTAHSVIARHRDARDLPVEVGFDGDRWRRFVPIRLPWTQLIQERLPANSAGVLLNRSHQHRDLILPIDAAEKRQFDAIDGGLSIEDIIQHASGDHRRARAFFEKLWWYDQVVFDTSNAR